MGRGLGDVEAAVGQQADALRAIGAEAEIGALGWAAFAARDGCRRAAVTAARNGCDVAVGRDAADAFDARIVNVEAAVRGDIKTHGRAELGLRRWPAIATCVGRVSA